MTDSTGNVKAGAFPNALIQVYTGDGKGKTTAAIGLGMRAFGHGYKVRMIQFMKGTGYTGEIQTARRLGPGFEIFQFGRGCKRSEAMRTGELTCDGCGECFIRKGRSAQLDIELARQAYDLAAQTLDEASADLVILDEIANAVVFGLFSVEDAVALIERRPRGVELVLTGRNMPQPLIDIADLVTEMRMVKHPFEQGIPARHGIEY
ncbi:MAG: cob(I)yrinic acid a,c-diamide adenosyltransferase [Clostridia bacterium]|nr:cob(I)yrinic acid a,c-diamide adenosyltransferase [Clostridia bacterium]